MGYTQDERLIAVHTPLGKDVLLLTAFRGEEKISGLFRYQLEMLSERESISPQEIVGKRVDFTIKLTNKSLRYFNGFVSSFSIGTENIQKLRSYRAEIVPWLWFLSRTADCRIFQNKTVPQILEQVFTDLSFTDFEIAQIKGPHRKWDYCVQYRETDFNFVSRLMEQEGIFYWFRHEAGKHTMVLADHKGAYKDLPEKEVECFAGRLVPHHIYDLEHQYEFTPGKWAQQDYNFETPSTNLMTVTPTLVPLPDVKKYEVYDYPGDYTKKPDGEALTKWRMEEDELRFHVVNAVGGCRTFHTGGKFTVKRHLFTAEEGKTYVITSIQHTAEDDSYLSEPQASTTEYSNTFSSIPAEIVFRPARTTPKPIVQGPQTAVIVGPAGEEIYTDKYGRVKVQFHWDREGKKDENSSCWIRASENWAGKQWGMVFNPRIGQEVIVDFLEGDPDQPIITGRVYNAEQMPPYTLPANQTQSGIKTRSSKGGGTANFNEIRFEDKKGEEQVYIHAEKNQDIAVENNETHWVGRDRTKTVDRDETITVKRHRSATITQNENLKVETGDRTTDIDMGNDDLTLGMGNRNVEIQMGNDDLTITMGNRMTKLNLGKCTTEAMQSIELKVGVSSLKVDQSGVTIKGPMITLDSLGMTKVNGTMVEVNGTGMLMLKGGVVMIS